MMPYARLARIEQKIDNLFWAELGIQANNLTRLLIDRPDLQAIIHAGRISVGYVSNPDFLEVIVGCRDVEPNADEYATAVRLAAALPRREA